MGQPDSVQQLIGSDIVYHYGKLEAPVRLLRGHASPAARFAFSQISVPQISVPMDRRTTSSLYDLPAEARRLSGINN
jgi:hypothetical protein